MYSVYNDFPPSKLTGYGSGAGHEFVVCLFVCFFKYQNNLDLVRLYLVGSILTVLGVCKQGKLVSFEDMSGIAGDTDKQLVPL